MYVISGSGVGPIREKDTDSFDVSVNACNMQRSVPFLDSIRYHILTNKLNNTLSLVATLSPLSRSALMDATLPCKQASCKFYE